MALARFLAAVEQECMVWLGKGSPDAGIDFAQLRLLDHLARLAPSLPAWTTGVFNGYGRVYVDYGLHLELASAECDSPYLVPSIVERQQALVARAVAALAKEEIELHLAANNHSGLLHGKTATWGSHESYLVERHPSTFGAEILPFLATRVYAGSGGVLHPHGSFVAGVRPLFLEHQTGGGTTHDRALHSTARDENHAGGREGCFRYHLIAADGHRSHFNLALQLGATALAIEAALWDGELQSALRSLPKEDWLLRLRSHNLLARPGQPPRVAPEAIAIQRLYLDAAARRASAQPDRPPWVERALRDWSEVLDAFERDDRAWLARRLDAFTKYELFSLALSNAGASWKHLRRRPDLLGQLALLDQSYHAFCDPDSPFERLERAGLLDHRVAPRIEPGSEPEPFVPETSTRARPRARFLREHASAEGMVMDWSVVHDSRQGRRRRLADPFAAEFGPWEAAGRPEERAEMLALARRGRRR